MQIRIDKLLANKGIGSRQQIRKYAKESRIRVNNNIIHDVSIKVNVDDIIYFDDKKIDFSQFTYVVMNKPAGYVSACKDNLHPTVIDILSPNLQKINLSPVGRLDIDTEGLIFLSNDGNFIHEIISPSKHVPKTYYVEHTTPLSVESVKNLENGVILITENYITKPAKIKIIDDLSCFITIDEGKFHQVKRMFSAVNNAVVYLKRISIGNYLIPNNLDIGSYMIVKKDDLTI